MNKLWQLKKISTGEALNKPQILPKNWGPIFGLSGFIDRLDNLEWLGEDYVDMQWVVVGEVEDYSTSLDVKMWERAKDLLKESDWAILSDVPMSAGERDAWIEYRSQLREIKLQPGFPEEIEWPLAPE
jgi:hypothetical protein